MRVGKLIIFILMFLSTMLLSEDKEVDTLLVKINQEENLIVKKELIEALKVKLAKVNKQAQEEADAIIKARLKIPLNNYNDTLLKK